MTISEQYELIITAVLMLMVLAIGYNTAFTNDVPVCDRYVANVYFYILFAIVLIIFSMLFIDKRRFAITNTKALIAFAISLSLLFILYSIPAENYIYNHLIWLLFIITLSVSIYGTWRYSRWSNVATSSAIITLIIFSILTAIAWLKPEWIGLNWGFILTGALLIAILAWIIPIVFGIDNYSNWYKILSAILLVIFSGLVLYDTRILRIKAEKCKFPDYPKDSLGLILDIVNMYSLSTNLQ